ncbi:hypothetical protein GGX14DRAFT_573975 [Mycena pura]|uniref:Ribonuclease H1 N-terminal domain-containing protein n=1 Tax=Mycena pura TaxID=153505 RepID=A0AAD6V2B9_9AGAR|nr:hypothetical protein GGX14DRAFT_573975 [Mycena pura]
MQLTPSLEELFAAVSLDERNEGGSHPAPQSISNLPVFDIDEIWESLTPEERGEGTTRPLDLKKKIPVHNPASTSPPRPAPPPAAPAPPPAAPAPPPAAPPAPLPGLSAVYAYSNLTTAKTETKHWYQAANATQGVTGGRVHAVVKSPKKKSRRAAAYVVFWGHSPGVKETWAETEAATSGFRGAIYQGYPSRPLAQSAFDFAAVRGWTSAFSVPLDIARVPLPVPDNPSTIARLHASRDPSEWWYVCYKGVNPGVFPTWIEYALNTQCISNSVHQSFERYDVARSEYEAAQSEGKVSILHTRR